VPRAISTSTRWPRHIDNLYPAVRHCRVVGISGSACHAGLFALRRLDQGPRRSMSLRLTLSPLVAKAHLRQIRHTALKGCDHIVETRRSSDQRLSNITGGCGNMNRGPTAATTLCILPCSFISLRLGSPVTITEITHRTAVLRTLLTVGNWKPHIQRWQAWSHVAEETAC
jgi:hypothetical protein